MIKSVTEKVKEISDKVNLPDYLKTLRDASSVFDTRYEAACITNYDKLYSTDYFAHQPLTTSYDIDKFPALLVQLAKDLQVHNLLDIGGGNGFLIDLWREKGKKSISLDYYDNPKKFCRKFDLSTHSTTQSKTAKNFIKENLGNNWIATCLDVAEHIDSEHLADFLLNLRTIVNKYLLISISTRPSSYANSFHSTIIPIETWKKLFLLVGFEVSNDNFFDELVRDVNVKGTSEELISISHWNKVNPFRDNKGHQHYLLLNKKTSVRHSLTSLRQRIAEILDISYRWDKRDNNLLFPHLTYSVNFIQDWSFARSIMDVWPSNKIRITLRADCISQSFQKVIKGYLRQKGIDYLLLSTVNDADSFLTINEDDKQIWMTTTGGNHSITHQLASVLMRTARINGFKTVTLQHGMTLPIAFSPVTEFVGAWDDQAQKKFCSILGQASPQQVRTLGSPQLLDAMLPQTENIIENRFGKWTANYSRKYLIGLNLHWNIHKYKSIDVYEWITKLAINNKDCLFFIKPHPDDSSVYDYISSKQISNILLIDTILLISMDWSLMRLLKAVDGIITTQSTLILDALAAQTPIVRLPFDEEIFNKSCIVNASFPSNDLSSIPTITDYEWIHGKIPSKLVNPPDYSFNMENFNHSLTFFNTLTKLNTWERSEESWESIDKKALEALFSSAKQLNLSENPHRESHAMDNALSIFLS